MNFTISGRCLVDGCTWTSSVRPLSWVQYLTLEEMHQAAQRMWQRYEDELVAHCQQHSPLEWIRTIQKLNPELAYRSQDESGIESSGVTVIESEHWDTGDIVLAEDGQLWRRTTPELIADQSAWVEPSGYEAPVDELTPSRPLTLLVRNGKAYRAGCCVHHPCTFGEVKTGG